MYFLWPTSSIGFCYTTRLMFKRSVGILKQTFATTYELAINKWLPRKQNMNRQKWIHSIISKRLIVHPFFDIASSAIHTEDPQKRIYVLQFIPPHHRDRVHIQGWHQIWQDCLVVHVASQQLPEDLSGRLAVKWFKETPLLEPYNVYNMFEQIYHRWTWIFRK